MSDSRPELADEWPALARTAADLHARRIEGYPAQIEAGKISAAAAVDGIRIMSAIAEDWRCAVARLDRPASTVTRAERIATLERAARVARRRSAAAPNDTAWALDAALVETLLWWERHPFGIGWIADFNREARARYGRTETAQAA